MKISKKEKEKLHSRPLPDDVVEQLLASLKRFVDCDAYYPPSYPTTKDESQFYWLRILSEELAKTHEYLAYEACYIGSDPDDWKITIELKPQNSNNPICALHYSKSDHFGHRNPDHSVIYGPHLHIYKDGNIAYAVPLKEEITEIYDIFTYFFGRYNIQEKVERFLI